MEQPIILGRIIYQHAVFCSPKSTCWATSPCNLTAILFAAVWLLNYMCNVVWSLLPSWLCMIIYSWS